VVLEFELTAYTLSHFISPFFVMSFFKIGSHELFALAGFFFFFMVTQKGFLAGFLNCDPPDL
jgi:hypothetical protein